MLRESSTLSRVNQRHLRYSDLSALTENGSTFYEIDHDARAVYSEAMQLLTEPPAIASLRPSQDQVAARLTSPTQTTYIDTQKISFERYGTCPVLVNDVVCDGDLRMQCYKV